MKPIKKLLIILLALTMVFTFGQPAFAEFGSQGGSNGEGGIQVDPNAKGTKYVGPLTIYYTKVYMDEYPYDLEGYTLTFFLRLKRGSQLYAFSGTAGTEEDPLPGDVVVLQDAIETFIRTEVIPRIYGCTFGNCPPAELKAYDLLADDDTSTCCNDMIYTIVDVTIAVRD